MTQRRLEGRMIHGGTARGRVLYSDQPLSFFGGVDLESGVVCEQGHPLEGQCVAGRVLVFPRGKGSTVGSYALYRLARQGMAPAALINHECETIVAVGAIISDIPCVDQIPIAQLRRVAELQVDATRGLLCWEES